MKRVLAIVLLTSLASITAFAADDSRDGTITLSGLLSPKVRTLTLAVKACPDDGGNPATLTSCSTEVVDPTNIFAGHAEDVTLGSLGTIETDDRKLFVQFELISNVRLYKNDFLRIQALYSDLQNTMKVNLEKLVFVEGGNPLFGLTTLGNSATPLAAYDDLISTSLPRVIGTSAADVYSQTADLPGVANNKVFDAFKNGNELVLRGIISMELNEESTSGNYETEIVFTLIGDDATDN